MIEEIGNNVATQSYVNPVASIESNTPLQIPVVALNNASIKTLDVTDSEVSECEPKTEQEVISEFTMRKAAR